MSVIFSWLQLSDIHFGHGSADYSDDQEAVLNALQQFIQVNIRNQVKIDAIFIAGDIAFSGKVEQYEKARTRLDNLAKIVNLKRSHIFLVPGNHDIDRDVDKDEDVGNLVLALRAGEKWLSDELKKETSASRRRLQSRMAAYLQFAAGFAPVEELPALPFSWKSELSVSDVTIRLFRLNTALLCAGDDDRGKLQVGMSWKSQLVGSLDSQTRQINLIMTQHPFLDGWLRNGEEADIWAREYAQIHLIGHVHDAKSYAIDPGHGASLLRLVSGALHSDPKEKPNHT